MATSGELITAVATALDVEALHLSRESVFIAMRELRNAEMIPTGGRGLSAAPMTEREAALLMIAVAGALQLKDSAETARRFSSLPLAAKPRAAPGPRDTTSRDNFLGSGFLDRPEFQGRAPSAHFPRADPPNFGQALELILGRSREKALFFDVGPEDVAERFRGRPVPFRSSNYLRVTLERPSLRASIAWGVMPYAFEELVFAEHDLESEFEDRRGQFHYQPPLVQTRTFGLRAVESVGMFLRYTSEREARSRRRKGI